jgi:predicted amidohydrolase
MKVGYLQFEPIFGKPEYNYEKIHRLISDNKAELLVLPELCTSGYTFIESDELEELAGSIPEGKDAKFFIDLAKDNDCVIIAGLPENDGNNFYNSSLITTPEGYLAKYRKVHLFNHEKKFFSKGNEGFTIAEYKGTRYGLAICFDWFFPEVMRILMLKGADIVCHPSNLVLPFCQDAMITRSLENRIFTITANRTGTESRDGVTFSFTGKSQITSPDGKVLKRASENSEEIGIVDIDPSISRNKTITIRNSLIEDRRIELYEDLIK